MSNETKAQLSKSASCWFCGQRDDTTNNFLVPSNINFVLPVFVPGKRICYSIVFPARKRSLFFCVRWADEHEKRHLCHGSKLTVLSMRGGYLATESSRDASCCAGSLNISGIIGKECVGHSRLKSQSAGPRSWTAVGSKQVSIHGSGSLFSYSSAQRTQKEKKTLLAGNSSGKTS